MAKFTTYNRRLPQQTTRFWFFDSCPPWCPVETDEPDQTCRSPAEQPSKGQKMEAEPKRDKDKQRSKQNKQASDEQAS